MLLSTNPDSPFHPLKERWIDKAESDPNIAAFAFTFADNPVLPPEYEAEQRAMLTGDNLARFVDGLWVIASGSIYGNQGEWSGAPPEEAPIVARYIGVDVGEGEAPTHAVLVCRRDMGGGEQALFVESEWRYQVSVSGPMSHDQRAEAILRAFDAEDGVALDGVWVDPSAPAMTAALRKAGARMARGGVNKVDEGIQKCQLVLERGELLIDGARCPHLQQEMSLYTWDPRAAERGEKKPLKKNDHGPDALRYLVASMPSPPRRLMLKDNRPRYVELD